MAHPLSDNDVHELAGHDDDLADRLNARLRPMGYDVNVSQPLQNLTFSGEVNKEVGLTANQRALTERFNSEILIQKVDNAQSSGK